MDAWWSGLSANHNPQPRKHWRLVRNENIRSFFFASCLAMHCINYSLSPIYTHTPSMIYHSSVQRIFVLISLFECPYIFWCSRFDELRIVDLTGMLVYGETNTEALGRLIPLTEELNLSENMISTWTDVGEIIKHLNNLRFLHLRWVVRLWIQYHPGFQKRTCQSNDF